MTDYTNSNRPHYFRACTITAIVTCVLTLFFAPRISSLSTSEYDGSRPSSHGTVTYSVRTPIAQTYRINVPSQDDVILPSSMTVSPHQTVICQGDAACVTATDGGETMSLTVGAGR